MIRCLVRSTADIWSVTFAQDCMKLAGLFGATEMSILRPYCNGKIMSAGKKLTNDFVSTLDCRVLRFETSATDLRLHRLLSSKCLHY